jgi:hypothetical protein
MSQDDSACAESFGNFSSAQQCGQAVADNGTFLAARFSSVDGGCSGCTATFSQSSTASLDPYTFYSCNLPRGMTLHPAFVTEQHILSELQGASASVNSDPMWEGVMPATTIVGTGLGGWMPVVSLWNESFDPFNSTAQRASVVSIGPPSRCAAGYACGAGSAVSTGSGTRGFCCSTELG